MLTATMPVTEPTMAASSGIFDVQSRHWDDKAISALELPRDVLLEVREADRPVGTLVPALANSLDLPTALPVWPAIGDNQAAFLGSVDDRDKSALVNVGTGGQVAAYVDEFIFAPPLETRPFPLHGHLLVSAGLCGGRSYALMENFFRQVNSDFCGWVTSASWYETMNHLATTVPPGCDGLRCEPFFTGTREHPSVRGSLTGISPENFTPAHLVRALLEGMARSFAAGLDLIRQTSSRRISGIVGSGNGLRDNPVLAEIVAQQCALPLIFTRHREEAAVGAARIAALAASEALRRPASIGCQSKPADNADE
jgi:sugar (pentulose or hexulose) kinase